MMPPSLGGDGWPIFQKGNILSATTKKYLEKIKPVGKMVINDG